MFSEKSFPVNSQTFPFFLVMKEEDSKSNEFQVIKLISYNVPQYVEYVLAPQKEFGQPKMTW